MAECVKITYDRYTQELVFEKVQGPALGVPVAKTITVISGDWATAGGDYMYTPISWHATEDVISQPVMSMELPGRRNGEDVFEGSMDVGISCRLPGPDPDEIYEFSRWTGWVTAHVQGPYVIGEVLQDMRDDHDTEAVIGKRISVANPENAVWPEVAPPSTTIVLRLYEKWPDPPSRENFWTDLQGSREIVD
jgi:hypothetical protein